MHTLQNDAICDHIFGCIAGFVSFVLGTTIFIPLIASLLNSGRETFLSLFVFAAIWLLIRTLGFDIAAD